MSLLRTMKAVGWSFLGIRKSSDHEDDLNNLNPLHVIAGALVAVALFIAALMVLVRWVTGSPA